MAPIIEVIAPSDAQKSTIITGDNDHRDEVGHVRNRLNRSLIFLAAQLVEHQCKENGEREFNAQLQQAQNQGVANDTPSVD